MHSHHLILKKDPTMHSGTNCSFIDFGNTIAHCAKSWTFTNAPCQNCRRCDEPVIIGAVWSVRLDMQPVSISITPFGLPGHKSGRSTHAWGKRLRVRFSPRKPGKVRVGDRSEWYWMYLHG
ncbi:hypothetical protein AVEN_271195-1 [Araneus ventricosus]|uniref:Uncharacterized protein n=1 Tax=Araneus ventricosus TaxID=182803 RepID=A0A4Y2QAJ3_ARAVE|nr:hypothetical protein AVEN_271195-1 [Araneus ventricosus]